ncbi:MAG: hypothetical protein ACT4NY_22320 [Pseudonocardiales bacterium]
MTTDAEEFQRRALALYRPNEYLDPALIQLDRAICMATTGEPDEACAHVNATVTAAPAEHRTGLIAQGHVKFTGCVVFMTSSDAPWNGELP